MSTQKDCQEKKLLVRLPKELHRQTRLLAFDLNVSMAELCRRGLEQVVLSYEKTFDYKQSKS